MSRVRDLRLPVARPPALRALVVGLVVVGLAAALVAGLLRLRVETGPESFAPAGHPAAAALADVGSAFGGDPVVALLESAQPRALLGADALPLLLDLEGRLARLPDVAAVYGPGTVLNQVAGRTQDLLAELAGFRDGSRAAAEERATAAGASPAEAAAAGRAAVEDFDRRYGALIVQGLPAGLPTLRNDGFVSSVVFGDGVDARPQWRFVVPAADAVAVLVRPRQGLDQAGLERLVDGVRAEVAATDLPTERTTVSGVPAVAAALGEQVRTEVPLLGAVALLAVGAWFGLVRWVHRRHRLVPLVATAVGTVVTLAGFGWAGRPLSLGVVAFLPVLIGVGSEFTTYLTRGASRRSVVAAGLAAAVAFGALAISPIPAVADLGVILAVGIAVSVAAGLVITRRRFADPIPAPEPAAPTGPIPPSRRVRLMAGGVAALLAATGWLALANLPLRADIAGFAGGLPALDDAEHVQDVLGSSGEFTIALSGGGAASPEALSWMQAAQSAVIAAEGDKLRPIISPPTLLGFLGAEPTDTQIDAALRLLPPYLTGAVLSADRSQAVLVFGTPLDDAEQLLALRESVRDVLPPPPAVMEVRLTGLPMVGVAAYEQVSADRYLANVLGIALAGLVLAVGLRHRGDAVLAVAAASLATGLGLAGLWATGTGLNPVTIALGSLTAAVGCEFTVLAADASRRGDRGLRKAVALAAVASATGYAVLLVSTLSMVSEFGVLLAVSVGLAYLSARFVVWTARIQPAPAALNTVGSEESLIGVSR